MSVSTWIGSSRPSLLYIHTHPSQRIYECGSWKAPGLAQYNMGESRQVFSPKDALLNIAAREEGGMLRKGLSKTVGDPFHEDGAESEEGSKPLRLPKPKQKQRL